MKILVTNDDGFLSPGLKIAERIAFSLVGETGKVVTVSPRSDQSGVGHCVSYIRPTMIEMIGPNQYTLEGSPADCVLAGLHHVMKNDPPDLVLSGVNKGHNIGEDITYSGTVGAAMEGALQDIKAIALSQSYSKETLKNDTLFDASEIYGEKICNLLLQKAEWNKKPYTTFYNVNFPAILASDVQGIAVACQGARLDKSSFFIVEDSISPNGQKFLWVNHKPKNTSADLLSDIEIINQKKISIVPLKADLTAHDEIQKLRDSLER